MSGVDHEISSVYADEAIDSVLARVDEALPKCYNDHVDDTEAIAKMSHQAVATVRKFRQEVLARTQEALGERDVQFLDPGDGPVALQEALGRVLKYTEARSRLAVERARWDQMMKAGTDLSPSRPARQQTTGKPLTYHRLSKELTAAVRLHVERVVDAAEVRRSSKCTAVREPRNTTSWENFVRGRGEIISSMVECMGRYFNKKTTQRQYVGM